MSATPGALRRTGRLHRVVAIGLGLGGLFASRTLKFAQLNVTDALVFVTSLIVHRTSHLVSYTSVLVPVIPAIAAVAAVGVVIALTVAVVAELAKHLVAQAPCHTGLRRLAKGGC
jgi:hypothetical protein